MRIVVQLLVVSLLTATSVQAITYIVPARYFLVALRAIVLKGAGVPVFWPQLVALTAYAAFMLTMASRRLKRQWM